MIEIPEYKRDSSKDYLFILKSLNEIPFPVGKTLLIDFLKGELENKSIEKNNLYNYNNFSALSVLSKEEIRNLIESVIAKNLVDVSGSVFSKFAKVISINKKGKETLISPPEENKRFQNLNKSSNEDHSENLDKFSDFLDGLNSEQKKAIVSKKEKILCVAGAGSGKTSVLTKRVEFVNKFGNTKEKKILAITFTKKAREEMESRLKSKGIEITIETFNSFCEKILRKHEKKIYSKKMKVASSQDKTFAILRAIDFEGLNFKEVLDNYFSEGQKRNKNSYQLQSLFISDCFSILEFFKFSEMNLESFRKKYFTSKDPNSVVLEKIVSFLVNYMAGTGMRTYTDQISDVINFFRVYPQFIPRFEHVFVDEFQDVNDSQIKILNFLNPENLFCVGDPRQSIFGWRGSKLNHILDFKNNQENSEIIILKKNYRSDKKIVDVMNELVKKMNLPSLESSFNEDGKISLNQFLNEEAEFNFIVSKILSSKTISEEIFVLARTNRQLEILSGILKRKGIFHKIKEENSQNFEVQKGDIVLSTVHAIKGLEAETVFVIGCTNNNFPCKSGDHPVIEKMQLYDYDREDEELRLFYVAVSRAKRNLYLTYSGKRHTYFLNEEIKKEMDFTDFS